MIILYQGRPIKMQITHKTLLFCIAFISCVSIQLSAQGSTSSGISEKQKEALKTIYTLYSDGYAEFCEPSIQYKSLQSDYKNSETPVEGDKNFLSIASFSTYGFCDGSNTYQFIVLFQNSCGGIRKENKEYFSVVGIFPVLSISAYGYFDLTKAHMENGTIKIPSIRENREIRLEPDFWWRIDPSSIPYN